MTKLVVCAILDSAVQAFNRPMFAPSVPAMVRSFTDEVNRKNPDNPMALHPDDFTLYQLAIWDDEQGDFEPAKRIIVRAKDVHKE